MRALLQWVVVVVAAVVAGPGCSRPAYREVQIDLGETDGRPPAERTPESANVFRFSVAAMLSPKSTHEAYGRLFSRVGQRVGVHVDLVQRRTYREVNDMLIDGQLDAAFLCTGGFLDVRRRAPGAVEVVAVPMVRGKTTYQSLIIVPGASAATGLADLAGRRFAFTDELSLSGRAYAVHLLRAMGRDPARFFGSTIFTHSHDRSIEAVANGLADGAAVDSLIYEFLGANDPALVRRTRVVHRSEPLGIVPIVVGTRVPEGTRARLRQVLLDLGQDAEAGSLLSALHIDRFVVPEPGLYDSAAALLRDLEP